jgi:hypothetical protein
MFIYVSTVNRILSLGWAVYAISAGQQFCLLTNLIRYHLTANSLLMNLLFPYHKGMPITD